MVTREAQSISDLQAELKNPADRRILPPTSSGCYNPNSNNELNTITQISAFQNRTLKESSTSSNETTDEEIAHLVCNKNPDIPNDYPAKGRRRNPADSRHWISDSNPDKRIPPLSPDENNPVVMLRNKISTKASSDSNFNTIKPKRWSDYRASWNQNFGSENQ